MTYAYWFKYIMVGDYSTLRSIRCWEIQHSKKVYRFKFQKCASSDHRSRVHFSNGDYRRPSDQTRGMGHKWKRILPKHH